MTRGLLLVLALAGCLEEHASTQVAVRVQDCYECHRSDYERAPNHVGARSTTCATCHRLADWQGLLGGTHPETEFVISHGPHEATLCADCHDPSISPDSTRGANVSCTGCHTGAHAMTEMIDKHRDVSRFSWDPARPTFCRDCHPLGL